MGLSVGRTILRLVAVCGLLLAAAVDAQSGPGRYEVGVTTMTFTKTSVSTQQPRPLETIIWYPAVAGTGTEEALGRRDADAIAKQFPWIVFSHGSCGSPPESSYLTMALASRGFVVAAPAHIGNTRSDPGCAVTANFIDSLQNRPFDVLFIVDAMLEESSNSASRFANRLRPDAIGITGLSFGGYTTLVAAQREPRFRAAMPMVLGGADVIDQGSITIPTLIIGSERDRVVGFADSEEAYDRVDAPRFLIKLLKGDHLSVTNDCFPLCLPDQIPQDLAHRIVVRSATAFFRHYLTHGRTSGRGAIRPMPHSVLTAEPVRPSPTATVPAG